MSGDLIALVVALTFGAAVVILGLRRNLSETTRSGLPRFGAASEQADTTVGLYEGEQRRRQLSPKQARWFASIYLLLGLLNAVDAVLSPDDRLIHAAAGTLFTLCAVAMFFRKWPYSP